MEKDFWHHFWTRIFLGRGWLMSEGSTWNQTKLIKHLKQEYFKQMLHIQWSQQVRMRWPLRLNVVRDGWRGQTQLSAGVHWPAGPRPLDPSCGCVDRFRFCWRRFPPVERAVRKCTSLTLKKATMKGCFSSAPSRPTRPTSLELMLCPVSEDTDSAFSHGI